ncbi:hypothetical protein A6R68_07782, partial [Neotoma lepida]
MDIEAYFERIGYQNSRNKLDLQTLTEILQHQIRAIPFENLNIHCGKPMELSLEAIFDHVTQEGVHGLVGNIIAYKKFNYKDNVDLVEFKTLKEEETEEVLKRIFGIHLETKLVSKH